MDWNSTPLTSTMDAKDEIIKDMAARGQRSGANFASGAGTSGGLFGWGAKARTWADSDVIGIQVAEVPNMRQAIRNYIDRIVSHLDKIEDKLNPTGAFQSEEVNAAVTGYLSSVKEYCIVLTTDLGRFSEKLQEVYDTWLKSTQGYATDTVNPAASALDSAAGARYQEQI